MEDSDATFGDAIASERGAARAAAGRDRARRAADMAEAEAEEGQLQQGKHNSISVRQRTETG
jgi:hypothetical protein